MPPRWLRLAIAAFWLSTTGWLFYHDLWPHLRPGQPPPLTVDLIDEVQAKRPPALWTVRLNDEKVFQGRTHIEHPSAEVFELQAELTSQPGCAPAVISGWRVGRLRSLYRVDPDGNLLGVDIEFKGQLAAVRFFDLRQADLTASLAGTVSGGFLRPDLRLAGDIPAKLAGPFKLPEVPVRQGGGVFLSMHPLNRMRGLRPGQSWSVEMLDPVKDSLKILESPAGGPHLLAAHVLKEPEKLDHGRRQGVSCLIVEMRALGEDDVFRLWVDERTGQVLRQEATLDNNHWVMDRD